MIDIKKVCQDWVNEAHAECMFHQYYQDKAIILMTEYPGRMIGYKGALFDKYGKQIEKTGFKIKFIEAHEFFKVGDDWDKIIEDRANAFFEVEG